jgi:hypothetical protein
MLLDRAARSVAVSSVVVILASCTAGSMLATTSGQVEIVLFNVDKACVRNRLLETLKRNGFAVRETNEDLIVVGRRSKISTGDSFFGMENGSREERITATFFRRPNDGLRLVVIGALVVDAGTAFERAKQIPASQTDQQQFEAIRFPIQRMCGGAFAADRWPDTGAA